MNIKEISVEELKNLNNSGLSLLQFYATWCGPCKLLKLEINKLLEENSELNVLQFDIDKDIELARSFGIKGVPALFLLKDNEILGSQGGFIPKDAIEDWIHSKLEFEGE